MSVWSYRLGSSSLFTRTNEGSTEPKRVVFLSVEGTKTEVQYLHFIEKYRVELKINALVHIEVLKRFDTKSDPENVLELLEEYIQFRENKMFENNIDSLCLKDYSTEFIKSYLEDDSCLTKKERRKFEAALREEQLDLLYLDFLGKYKGKDDAFGIVIVMTDGDEAILEKDRTGKDGKLKICKDKYMKVDCKNRLLEKKKYRRASGDGE